AARSNTSPRFCSRAARSSMNRSRSTSWFDSSTTTTRRRWRRRPARSWSSRPRASGRRSRQSKGVTASWRPTERRRPVAPTPVAAAACARGELEIEGVEQALAPFQGDDRLLSPDGAPTTGGPDTLGELIEQLLLTLELDADLQGREPVGDA